MHVHRQTDTHINHCMIQYKISFTQSKALVIMISVLFIKQAKVGPNCQSTHEQYHFSFIDFNFQDLTVQDWREWKMMLCMIWCLFNLKMKKTWHFYLPACSLLIIHLPSLPPLSLSPLPLPPPPLSLSLSLSLSASTHHQAFISLASSFSLYSWEQLSVKTMMEYTHRPAAAAKLPTFLSCTSTMFHLYFLECWYVEQPQGQTKIFPVNNIVQKFLYFKQVSNVCIYREVDVTVT